MQEIWEGDIVYEYIPATDKNPTPEVNRVSGLHYGYEQSKNSVEYGVYTKLMEEYQSADKAYTAAVKDEMKNFVYNAEAPFNGGNKNTKMSTKISCLNKT